VWRQQDIDPEACQSDALPGFSMQTFFVCELRHYAEMLALTRFIYAC
jgi:hypothetical protein